MTHDGHGARPNRSAKRRTPQNVAWWPVHPDRDPAGRDEPFFYRPRQLLVRRSEIGSVHNTLKDLDVMFSTDPDLSSRPVARLRVIAQEPVPSLLRRLRDGGMGPETVGPNHVFWPLPMNWTDSFTGQPWLSGGSEGWPVEAPDPPNPRVAPRGAGVTVALFDSGLLPDWNDQNDKARCWLTGVQPARLAEDPANSPDVEGRGGDPDTPCLDLYDSHATFVAGVVKCAAPQARILVRNVLSEAGDVDDFALSQAIRDTVTTEALAGRAVDVINLSLGGTTLNNQPPMAMQDLVDDPGYQNILFVAAAGNNDPNGDPMWPAALLKVVGVGALEYKPGQPPVRAPFSNVKSADVWAPGVEILGAFGRDTPPQGGENSEDYTSGSAWWSGTSFAAPLVAGVLCEDFHAAVQQGAVEWLRNYAHAAPGADVYVLS